MQQLLSLLTADIELEGINQELTETFEELGTMSVSEILLSTLDSLKAHLPTLLRAGIFFVIGYLLIKLLMRFLRDVLSRSRTDGALHGFILSSIKITLYIILALTCIGILGVNFTPMIAALGAFGLAVSLAVQGILSNIAGGISVLFSPPFSKGDYVEVGDQPGTILEIGLIYTTLQTLDNKLVYLPNGDVAKSVVVNFSTQPIRRIDLTFYVKADGDLSKVRTMILDTAARNPLALADPAPAVRITDQTYQHVNMTLYVWTKKEDLFELKSQLIGDIRSKMNVEGM